MRSWKEKVKMRNEKDWEEGVSSKSTLKWYKLVKNGAWMERYLRCVMGQEVVRLLFRQDWLSWVVRGQEEM